MHAAAVEHTSPLFTMHQSSVEPSAGLFFLCRPAKGDTGHRDDAIWEGELAADGDNSFFAGMDAQPACSQAKHVRSKEDVLNRSTDILE